MIKKNIKKFKVLILLLIIIGFSGLFLSLIEFNSHYVKNKFELSTVKNELNSAKKDINIKNAILKDYGLLRFKTNAISSKFPKFSMILESVYNRSLQYNFEPELVLSMIQVESNFKPDAVSNRGAYGLMQVNLDVWEDELNIDKDLIFDIDYNINLGLQVLKRYYDETRGDLRRAIHLYNNGYRYNNLEYLKKVDSVFLTFSTRRFNLKKAAPLN